jgi:beta-ribofuranosylaminobenzene 5'-phosphate synthase
MSEGSRSRVTVRAGYRIHLGFYRFRDGRFIYGGLGAALEEPQLVVSVEPSNELRVDAPTEEAKRLMTTTLRHLKADKINLRLSGYVAHHVGLGSYTRIVLATASAVSTYLRSEVDLIDIASSLGRGKISGVGIYSFVYGNLIADAGMIEGSNRIPPLLGVYRIPRNWHVVVTVPEGIRGLSDYEEMPIMREIEAHPHQDVLYKEFMRLIASVTLGDFINFSKALGKIQELTGEYFKKYQGGVFCCETVEEIVNIMKSEGLRGVGQSSWGPAVYGFVSNYVKAVEIRSRILEYLNKKGVPAKIWVTNVARLGHYTNVSRRI